MRTLDWVSAGWSKYCLICHFSMLHDLLCTKIVRDVLLSQTRFSTIVHLFSHCYNQMVLYYNVKWGCHTVSWTLHYWPRHCYLATLLYAMVPARPQQTNKYANSPSMVTGIISLHNRRGEGEIGGPDFRGQWNTSDGDKIMFALFSVAFWTRVSDSEEKLMRA